MCSLLQGPCTMSRFRDRAFLPHYMLLCTLLDMERGAGEMDQQLKILAAPVEESSSQHPHVRSQTYVTVGTGDLISSSGFD